MSNGDHDASKPRFNSARGADTEALQAKPPFDFTGVTARVFPLRANPSRLTRFCDLYLNKDLPSTIAHFQPAIPYVYLMILHYGRMSVEAENLGWVSQNEVAFTVPLEWYREVDGKLEFHDWAAVSPFIFVDDEMSLTTGRDVYGWPKVLAWFDEQINPWAVHPRAPRRLLNVSTDVFGQIYAGHRQVRDTLLAIDQTPPLTVSEFPPSRSNPFNPLTYVPDAIKNIAGLAGQAMDLMTQLPMLGHPRDRDAEAVARMWARAQESIGALVPGWLAGGLSMAGDEAAARAFTDVVSNQINLKQFRDAAEPESASFQAIINSKMVVKRFNGGGMLGDLNLMTGDPSGGLTISVHRHPSQPIVESLGLEIVNAPTGEDQPVAQLRPVFPFWVDMDMSYDRGRTICSRTKHDPAWRVPGQASPPPPRVGSDRTRYNTARGAAIQEIAGPFRFPNTTIRVLPLLADNEKLDRFLQGDAGAGKEGYLDNAFYEFEAWGSYVYLVAINYDGMLSENNDIGWWTDRELEIVIPVKVYDKTGAARRLVSTGLVAPFVFVNTSTAAISGREVDGRPVFKARLEAPDDTWMNTEGPVADRRLLRHRIELLPVLGLGQRAELRTLIETNQGDVASRYDYEAWHRITDEWGHDLLRDHKRKVALKRAQPREYGDLTALAIELLANGQPINEFTLKQFRDSDEPENACFQSIVQIQSFISHVHDIREIEDKLHVGIHRYKAVPVVDLLGLKVKRVKMDEGHAVDWLQPLRPFWMRVDLAQDLGRDLCWRAGSRKWHSTEPLESYFTAPGDPAVGMGLLRRVDDEQIPVRRLPRTAKQNLMDTARDWLREVERGDAQGDDGERLTRSGAERAVKLASEPNIVLEHVLSREWMSWGRTRWYRELQERRRDGRAAEAFRPGHKPDLCVRSDSVGPYESHLFPGLGGEDWYPVASNDGGDQDGYAPGAGPTSRAPPPRPIAAASVPVGTASEARAQPAVADESQGVAAGAATSKKRARKKVGKKTRKKAARPSSPRADG